MRLPYMRSLSVSQSVTLQVWERDHPIHSPAFIAAKLKDAATPTPPYDVLAGVQPPAYRPEAGKLAALLRVHGMGVGVGVCADWQP